MVSSCESEPMLDISITALLHIVANLGGAPSVRTLKDTDFFNVTNFPKSGHIGFAPAAASGRKSWIRHC